MSNPLRRWTALFVAVLSTGVVACSSDSPNTTPAESGAPSSAGIIDSSPVSETTSGPDSETSDATPDTTPSASSEATTAATDIVDASVSADVSALTAAGMTIVDREDQPVETSTTEAGHTLITTVQARRMVADVSTDSGILGSDIDAMVVLPADVPSLSYFVAGWVTQGVSASAQEAHQWMGDQDWTHAPLVRFPMAVVAMFVTEMAISTASEASTHADPSTAPGTTDVQPGSIRHGFGRSDAPRALAGPCTAVTAFIATTINGIFKALQITAPSGTGIFATIGQALAGVFNFAIDLAQSVVQGLVSVLTAPVLNVIAIAVAALGVVTVVVSFFKDETLTLHLDPPPPANGYAFALDQDPDISADIVATAKDLTGDWPPLLKDCAKASGVSLPELLPVGAPTIWEVAANGLITTGSPNGVVLADHTARLTFTTGRESRKAAERGIELHDAAVATVRVPRHEIDAILDLAKSKLNDAKASVLAQVPSAARAAATQALNSAVDPTINGIQNELSGAGTGLFTLSGTYRVFIRHHTAPPETTIEPVETDPDSAPTDSSDGGDFCTQFKDLVTFARDNPPGDVVAWATEIVNRLQTMRPSAPAEVLGDVDVMLRVYSAVAASADILVIIQTTEPFPDATMRLAAFCGISF